MASWASRGRPRRWIRACASASRSTLQDGRTLVCTPDHKLLCADGRWVRADKLELGRDRVVVGWRRRWTSPARMRRAMRSRLARCSSRWTPPTSACARWRSRGCWATCSATARSASSDRAACMSARRWIARLCLNDIELITGERPAATRYDERKWTIVLPSQLTDAIMALPGVRVGRRITQAPSLPAFVLDDGCPVAVVREFLGGLFGADGHAPVLHRWGKGEDNATLEAPAYSQSAHTRACRRAQAGDARIDSPAGALRRGDRGREDLQISHAPRGIHLSRGAGWRPRIEVRLSWRTASHSWSALDTATAWIRRCGPARRRSTGARSAHQPAAPVDGGPSRGTARGAGRAVVYAGAPDGGGGADGARER